MNSSPHFIRLLSKLLNLIGCRATLIVNFQRTISRLKVTYTFMVFATSLDVFLAHLSRRLIGELIVYKGIRHPSVVRLSTFSNDISSEAEKPILFIFHI